jgi:hypothetical protein
MTVRSRLNDIIHTYGDFHANNNTKPLRTWTPWGSSKLWFELRGYEVATAPAIALNVNVMKTFLNGVSTPSSLLEWAIECTTSTFKADKELCAPSLNDRDRGSRGGRLTWLGLAWLDL